MNTTTITMWRIATDYAATLTEPLLDITDRVRREERFAREYLDGHHEWARTVLSGAIANLMQSLADKDPWRNLAGRYGAVKLGNACLPRPGAATPDGVKLRDWRAMYDLLGEPQFAVGVDPSYAALDKRSITPETGFLLAAGVEGWGTVSLGLELMPRPLAWESAQSALVWALHRRRCYGVPADEGFIRVSFSRWAVDAWNWAMDFKPLPEEANAEFVADHRLPWVLDEHPPME